MDGRPHLFGSLRPVVPAVQTQRRGEWEMTLASLELWDGCWVANVDLLRDPPGGLGDGLGPRIDLEAADERGGRYAAGYGGGSGGGRRDGGEAHRFLVPFTPALDPAADGVRLAARLRVHRYGDDVSTGRVLVWEDSDPWIFSVALAGAPAVPSDDPRVGSPSDGDPPSPGRPPELVRLRRVVPVVVERTDAGWASWTVTGIAVEIHDGGFRLDVRVLGPPGAVGDPTLGVRVTDERGTAYRLWDGGGTGLPTAGACHWRLSYLGEPAPATGVRELRIEADEIRIMTFRPDPDRAGMCLSVVAERCPIAWGCVVDLR